MEVLVIDDGSKESQDEVVRPYIDRFPQSIQMIHKENGGHGSVINKAAEIATGKYLKILDADDWVVSKNMKSLLDSLERLNADVVITHFDMVDAEERFRQSFTTENVKFEEIYTMDDLAQLPKSVYACSTFHGIFYRLAFYRSTQIQMSEKVFYEDQEYATLPFCFASGVVFLNLTIYQYLVGRPGQSVSHEHYDMSESRKRYFQYKIGAVIVSYYVAALLKNPDRRKGRCDVAMLRQELHQNSRDLMQQTEKKYWITKALLLVHMTPNVFGRIKRTRFYYILKKFM